MHFFAPLFYSCDGYPHKINLFLPSCIIYYFLLEGHKVGFIAPCGANKSIFDPLVEKKSCYRGKTLILHVWLLPLLFSAIKFHTRKINLFLPSCIIYGTNKSTLWPPVEKIVQRKKKFFFSNCTIYYSCVSYGFFSTWGSKNVLFDPL